MVGLGWVLFRSASLVDALNFAKSLAGLGTTNDLAVRQLLAPATCLALAAGVACAVPMRLPRWPQVVEYAALGILLLTVLAAIAGSTYKPFIYFRF